MQRVNAYLTSGVRWFRRGRQGGLMVEAIIAVLVFTLVGTTVLSGLSTSKIAGARAESQSIAENIARNQMERVLEQVYQGPSSSYQPVSTSSGYSVTAFTEEFVLSDSNIEKIVVTVSHQGETVLVLETLRTLK